MAFLYLYISKYSNAPTNATYFTKMADGGDTSTTLTTQGDILYINGSVITRLGAGTSGYALYNILVLVQTLVVDATRIKYTLFLVVLKPLLKH